MENCFTALINLEWLDLRDNCIKELPPEIGYAQNLQCLLLDNNNITQLPNDLGTDIAAIRFG